MLRKLTSLLLVLSILLFPVALAEGETARVGA